MSYHEKLNRYSELQTALAQMGSNQHVQQSLRRPAEMAGQRSLAELRQAAPIGTDEPDYVIERRTGTRYTVSHGRPSIRLFGVSLIDAWGDPDIKPISMGMQFTISSNAPHMGILLAGSPAHDIPKAADSPLSFWSFARNEATVLPWEREYTISHPGFPKSTFVTDTLNRGLRGQVEAFRNRGIKNTTTPLTNFFGR